MIGVNLELAVAILDTFIGHCWVHGRRLLGVTFWYRCPMDHRARCRRGCAKRQAGLGPIIFHQFVISSTFYIFSISFLHNKVFRGLTSPAFAAFWPKIASHTKNISSTKRTNAENIFTQGLIFESAGRALT